MGQEVYGKCDPGGRTFEKQETITQHNCIMLSNRRRLESLHILAYETKQKFKSFDISEHFVWCIQ